MKQFFITAAAILVVAGAMMSFNTTNNTKEVTQSETFVMSEAQMDAMLELMADKMDALIEAKINAELKTTAYTEYDLIKHPAALGFMATVESKLAEGWDLIGGVFYDGTDYYQTLAK